jgi:NADPH2:quinone reductase
MGQSAYAEYTIASAKYTIPLPDSIDNKTGAAAMLQALTAITLIREAYEVKKGDWILVTAAAGGVGLWLCQLLKAVGARTIATASTPEKRELAEKNGAEVTLEYHEEDRDKFVEDVVKITGGEGVSAVLDSVGKATFDAVLQTVKRKGTLVSFGNASGAVEGFALAYVDSPPFFRLSLLFCWTVIFPCLLSEPPTPIAFLHPKNCMLTPHPQPPLGKEHQAPPPHTLQLRLHP